MYQTLSLLLENSNPDIKVGDVILVGKFKNRTAVVTGFSKDENNQPQVETDKGTYSLYRFRINKLMPRDRRKDESKIMKTQLEHYHAISKSIFLQEGWFKKNCNRS